MDLTNVVLFSGEGEFGHYYRFTGRPTLRAVKMKVRRETSGGIRFATAYAKCGPDYGEDCYIDVFTKELKIIPEDKID